MDSLVGYNMGASRMDRRTLDWILRMRTMFETFNDLHTSIVIITL
jgi:hypothetical protein